LEKDTNKFITIKTTTILSIVRSWK